MTNEIKEIKVNKANKSITFINNGIAFLQFGVADEILDLITNLQEENERLKDLYRRTSEHLFKIGNDELARYFQAQINDCPSFVPQYLRGDE